MIAGTRLVPPRSKAYAVCPRCGNDMPKPSTMHLVPEAPCRDCREVLEDEGVPSDRWTTREKVAA